MDEKCVTREIVRAPDKGERQSHTRFAVEENLLSRNESGDF